MRMWISGQVERQARLMAGRSSESGDREFRTLSAAVGASLLTNKRSGAAAETIAAAPL